MFIFCCLYIQWALARQSTLPVSTASIESFYSYSADRLDSFEKVDLSTLKGKPSLWILFQPECKSCESQLNDLSCLNNIETIAVGFWGTRERLNKVLRFSKFKGLKLMASKGLEKMTNLKITPTLLIINKDGILKETLLAKTPCDQLKTKLENISW